MIDLKGIKKIYKGKGIHTVALNDINLSIDAGEFLCIMGRSGSGKTTLLNVLGCMDDFDEGEYIFDGIDVKKLKSRELASFRSKNVGFVFQSFNLIDDMNVLENVEVPLGYAGMPSKKRMQTALEMIKKLGMQDKIKHYPSELSGGQQQRVAIARALANNPKIILADEPTGNLDSENGEMIMTLLKNLNEEGKTIILVTHDMSVAKYAKRKIIMNDGKIINNE